MTALTIDLDDRLIHVLRATAARRGTTVDAIVEERVEPLASDEEREDARLRAAQAELRELMEKSTGRLEPNQKWNRAELYEYRMLPRHQHLDLRGPGSDG